MNISLKTSPELNYNDTRELYRIRCKRIFVTTRKHIEKHERRERKREKRTKENLIYEANSLGASPLFVVCSYADTDTVLKHILVQEEREREKQRHREREKPHVFNIYVYFVMRGAIATADPKP